MSRLTDHNFSAAEYPSETIDEHWLGFRFFESEQDWNARVRALTQECLARQARLHQLLPAAVNEFWIAECNQYASPLYRDHALLTHRRYMQSLATEIEVQEALYALLSQVQRTWQYEDKEALESQLDKVFESIVNTRLTAAQLFSLNKRNARLTGDCWGLEVDVHLQDQFENHLLVLGSGRRQQKPRRPTRNKQIAPQPKTKKTKLEPV